MKKKINWLWTTYVAYVVGLTFFFIWKVFPTYADHPKTKAYFVVALLLLFFVTGFLLWQACNAKKLSYERVFLVVALCWGILNMMFIPLAITADGHVHLGTSYAFSNKILGIDESDYGVSDEYPFFVVYVRPEDTNTTSIYYYEANSYNIVSENSMFGAAEDGKVYPRIDMNFENSGDKYFKRYVFSGLGIAIARLLHLSYFGMIYMGRLFNLLAFTAIGFVCVKLLPTSKMQVVSLAMMPIALQMLCSLHYDAEMDTCILLFTSMVLYYSKREAPLKIWEVLLLAALWVIIVPQKYIFAFYGLFIFLIPWKRWKSIFQKKITVILFISAVVAVGVFVYVKYFDYYVATAKMDKGNWGVPSILQNMWFFWDTMKNTFMPSNLYNNLYFGMGAVIGQNQILLPAWGLLLVFATMVAGLVVKRGNGIGKKRAIIAALIMFLVLMVENVALMGRVPTTITSYTITLFGRYSLPLVIPVLLFLGSDAKESRASMLILYAQSIAMTTVMCSLVSMVM